MYEMTTKNDCNGQDVSLDLDMLISVCSGAVSNARDAMERQKASIDEHIFQSFLSHNDPHMQYVHRCNAATETEFYERAAHDYAMAVKQWFYLNEAKVRDGKINIER
jgi:hypothetical protein